VLLLVLATAACKSDSAPDADPAAEASVISLINAKRAEAGCAAVTADGQLSAAALRHAKDMRANGVTDHTGSDGSTPAVRIADAGFAGTGTGEILYRSSRGDAAGAVESWMDSPGHRDIITDCAFTHAGAGVLTDSGFLAVTAFGTR
jgi:uncharacterized protein YkwD